MVVDNKHTQDNATKGSIPMTTEQQAHECDENCECKYNELVTAVRRYLDADPTEQVHEWQEAGDAMAKLVGRPTTQEEMDA